VPANMTTLLEMLVVVPLVTGGIGWFTNWAAVKMIFSPEKFWGVGPLGWQGILPRNATGFAQGAAEVITGNLVSARDLISRLDPAEVERLLEQSVDREAERIVREAAEQFVPEAWASSTEEARAPIIAQVRVELLQVTRDIFERLQGVSDELLDLKRLVVEQLSGKNTGKLVRMFQEIGARELKFIEYYGGIFGALIGLVHVSAWSLLQAAWVMPVVGVLVGLVTNWLAIQMIFRPMEPKRFLGLITYQGLFPKRQEQISRDYARLTAEEILSARNLVRMVTEGDAGTKIARTVIDTLGERLQGAGDRVRPLAPVDITDEMLQQAKASIVERLTMAAPLVTLQLERYLDRRLDVARTVEDKLARLPKPDFERILRGLFEKDEKTLIFIGGVLGGLVGLLQAALLS
jgi:uncharacterized membrane protein YheB (UPF0754 family)